MDEVKTATCGNMDAAILDIAAGTGRIGKMVIIIAMRMLCRDVLSSASGYTQSEKIGCVPVAQPKTCRHGTGKCFQ